MNQRSNTRTEPAAAAAGPQARSRGGAHRHRQEPAGVSRDDFQRRRYFGPLDGLRAVSILLVITAHTTDPMWNRVHGAVGVTIFFVISGFLITTLLLREGERDGRPSLKGFYIRRAFRILPLYYLTLILYIVIVGVLRLQPGASALWHEMPWYATYQNDLAPPERIGVYDQTWSLAIEEKYYLLWPLVFVVPVLQRHRLALTSILAAVSAAASLWHPTDYFAIYFPILLGCLLAIAMDDPRFYQHARRLANTPVALALIIALAGWDYEFENGSKVHIVFSILTVLLFPAILIGPRWLARILGNPVAVYIGRRSYIVYLIHRIAKGMVDRVVAPGSSSIPHELLHFALILLLSLAGAEILARSVEQPMIRLGRRLAAGRKERAGPSGSLERDPGPVAEPVPGS